MECKKYMKMGVAVGRVAGVQVWGRTALLGPYSVRPAAPGGQPGGAGPACMACFVRTSHMRYVVLSRALMRR